MNDNKHVEEDFSFEVGDRRSEEPGKKISRMKNEILKKNMNVKWELKKKRIFVEFKVWSQKKKKIRRSNNRNNM